MNNVLEEISAGIKNDTINPILNTRFMQLDEFNYDVHSKNAMGIIEFGEKKELDREQINGIPYLFIKMKLVTDCNYIELWSSNCTPTYYNYKNLMISTNGSDFFIGCSTAIDHNNAEQASKSIYDRIFKVSEGLNLFIYKIWNYIPSILSVDKDNNNIYKKYCYGRAQSFEENKDVYPAATGIGCDGNNACVYLIASVNNDFLSIENYRQTPAYKYPKKYGMKSPSFARASCRIVDDSIKFMYISGTASIIGSENQFTDDVKMQTVTTIENIKELIGYKNLKIYNLFSQLNLENVNFIKIYIKNYDDYETIKNICDQYFDTDNIMYFITDICRDGLLVEIEGMI